MHILSSKMMPVIQYSDSDDDERPSVGGKSTKATRPWYLLIAEIWSFVWPNEFALQIRLVGCLACLVAARILAMLVPITYKIMIDELSEITLDHDRGKYSTSLGDAIGRVWPYMVALFLVGGGGGFSGILVDLRTLYGSVFNKRPTGRFHSQFSNISSTYLWNST